MSEPNIVSAPARITWSWIRHGIVNAVFEDDLAGEPADWLCQVCEPDPSASLVYEREHRHLARFWWAEGNGSCDCNRKILFAEHDDGECGEEITIHRIEAIGVDVAALVYDKDLGLIHEPIAPAFP